MRVPIVIVGGGPAGLSTALFLAHSAPELSERIVVVERYRYPREKICAGGIGARAEHLLASIGVQIDVPSVPIHGLAFRAMGQTSIVRERQIGRVVRRAEYDHELARTAQSRGIRVLDDTRVTAIRKLGQRHELETSRGRFSAKVVIGADGVGSVVRRQFGFFKGAFTAQAVEVDTQLVASDLERGLVLFDASERALPGYYWDFPTLVNGKPMMSRGVYLIRRSEQPASVEIADVLGSQLEARGLSLDSHRKKRFAERIFDRRLCLSCPGVLLVGEAAGIDPMTGEGIAQAVEYGALAGDYLSQAFNRNAFQFDDWSTKVHASHVGRDLWGRSLVAPFFYGSTREKYRTLFVEHARVCAGGSSIFWRQALG